ncbi:MAG: pentapeptide repeat-containing protein [Bacteroidota bacterium]
MDSHDATTPDQPDDASPEALQKKLQELEQRNAELEAEVQRYEERAKAQGKAAVFAGEVAVKSVAGAKLTRATERGWDAWENYFDDRSTHPFPRQETRDFFVALVARLTRIRGFYLLAAAIPSFFVLIQVILLYQQNSRIDYQNILITNQNELISRQNRIVEFDQTTRFRDMLYIDPVDTNGNIINNIYSISSNDIYNDSLVFWPQPNFAAVQQIINFARDNIEIVPRAIEPLIQDPAPPVSIGAILVLSNSDIQSGIEEYYRKNDSLDFRTGILKDAYLSGIILNDLDLRGNNFSGAILNNSRIDNTRLEGTNFSSASLKGASISNIYLNRSDLSNVYMDNINIYNTTMENFDFSGMSIEGARIDSSNINGNNYNNSRLSGASFSGSKMRGSTMIGTAMDNVSIEKSDMSGSRIENIQGRGITLREVDMNNVLIIRSEINRSLFESIYGKITVEYSELQYSSMVGINIGWSIFRNNNATGVDMSESFLDGADLFGSTFDSANLEGASMNMANVDSVSFGGAKMAGVKIYGVENWDKVRSFSGADVTCLVVEFTPYDEHEDAGAARDSLTEIALSRGAVTNEGKRDSLRQLGYDC